MRLNHVSGKPIRWSILIRKGHWTRSYALAMSSLSATLGVGLHLGSSWNSSWANRTLSLRSLPLINPLWLGEMTRGRRGKSLAVRIFVIILFVTLHRLIGRKSDQETGSSFLGISTMDVAVTLHASYAPLKNWVTASITSYPIIDHTLGRRGPRSRRGQGYCHQRCQKRLVSPVHSPGASTDPPNCSNGVAAG